MANTTTANVIRVDTTAALAHARHVHSIKYIGASSGTAVITSTDSSNNLWEESGTANVFNGNIEIHDPGGMTVTVTNSAVVYLYLRVGR